MNYPSTLKKLFSINQQGVKLGLDNMRLLQKALGFPDKNFHSIHIAGTNGKGSVACKMAAALEDKGHKVGLFTSPHIATYRERIQVNGKMISEEEVVALFKQIESTKIQVTFFEVTTAMALLYFAQENVDYALIETGLGGRLDATNVIAPILTIITSIDYDHMEYLGNTLEEIAREKRGIIKEGVTNILGPTAQVVGRGKCVKGTFDDPEEENCAIAEAALTELGITSDVVSKVRPPCRFEEIGCTIFDVAHNLVGISALMAKVRKKYPEDTLGVVCAFSKGKAIAQCIKIIEKEAAHIYCVSGKNGRNVPASDLEEFVTIPSSSHGDIRAAVELAKREHDRVVVCGSFFIMADAKGIDESAQDLIEINEKFETLI